MSEQWYAHYPGDYARDTADLSMMETGAYRLLLDHYYSTGAPLLADRVRLYRICRAFEAIERQAVDTVLDQFFLLDDGVYHNRRADRELTKRAERKSTLSESGRRGAEQRWKRPNDNDGQANGHPNGHPNGAAIARPQPQPQPPNPHPETHTASRPPAEAHEPGAQPDGFQLKGEQAAQPQVESDRGENCRGESTSKVLLEIYGQERGPLPAVRAETHERVSKCRRRLLSHINGQEKFLADFRAAVRKASQISWPGWRPSFDWFIASDTNLEKVLEGNYDQWRTTPTYPGGNGSGRGNGKTPAAVHSNAIGLSYRKPSGFAGGKNARAS